jgi:excisionase family DNA binding protein
VIFISSDPRLAGHIAHAVALHLQWLQRNGLHAPPELGDLLSALEDRSGQQGTPLAFAAEPVEARLVGYNDAAGMLGVHPRTIRRVVARGDLPVVRIGRRALIPVSAIEGFSAGGVAS